MISESDDTNKLRRHSSELGLRTPTEVLSTNYILKTEQNQSLIRISKIYYSQAVLITNFFAVGLSSFLIYWWAISFPYTTVQAWYYAILILLYLLLFIEASAQIYLWSITKLNLFSIVFLVIGSFFIGISQILSRKISFFLGGSGVLIPFLLYAANVSRAFYHHRTIKHEVNAAQKMIIFNDSKSGSPIKSLSDQEEHEILKNY